MALAAQLKELINELCSCPLDDAYIHASVTDRIVQLVQHAKGADDVAELASCCQACEALTGQGKRIVAAWRSGSKLAKLAAVGAWMGILYVLQPCISAAAALGAVLSSRLMGGSVQLVLTCRELYPAAHGTAVATPDLPGSPDGMGPALVEMEACFMCCLLEAASMVGHPAVASLANAAPVAELTAWLKRCTAQLQLCQTDQAFLVKSTERLSLFFHQLHSYDAFAHHAAALKRDVELQHSLLALIVPVLGQHAAKLGQQPRAQPAIGVDWVIVSHLAAAASHMESPAWQRWLAAEPGVHSGSAVAAVSTLVSVAPPPLNLPSTWQPRGTALLPRLTGLLGRLCLQLRMAPVSNLLGGASVWRGQCHSQLARQLLRALPSLFEQLQRATSRPAPHEQSTTAGAAAAAAAASAQPAAGIASDVIAAVLPTLVFFHYLVSPSAEGTNGGRALFSMQQLPEWCRVASQALSTISAVAQLAQSLPRVPGSNQPSALACAMLDISTQIASDAAQVTLRAILASGSGLSESDPAAAAEAHSAMWWLHSTACRVAQSSRLLCSLLGLQPAHTVGQVVALLDSTMNAAWVFGAAWVQTPCHRRSSRWLQRTARADAAAAMCKALKAAPPAFCTQTERDHDGFSLMIRVLQHERQLAAPQFYHVLYTSVLHGLHISPFFAARLAASGALEWIAADLTGSQSAMLGLEQAHEGDMLLGLALLATASHLALESAGSEQGRATSNIAQHRPALVAALNDLTKRGRPDQLFTPGSAASHALLHAALPAARRLGAALLEWWALPEQAGPLRLEAAQAAAARSCTYLRCANLAAKGGPAAGQGVGSMRCSACRAVWYCGTACSHADWREGGHRRLCKALGATRQQAKQAKQATQGKGGASQT